MPSLGKDDIEIAMASEVAEADVRRSFGCRLEEECAIEIGYRSTGRLVGRSSTAASQRGGGAEKREQGY